MDWQLIINGIIIGLLASIPLGPIGVLCIQRTLNKGHLSGFVSGLGAAVSDAIYAIGAVFFLSVIYGFINEQMLWIKVFGALILIGLGVKIYSTNPVSQLRKLKRSGRNLVQDFISTFLLTASNPLVILIFLGLFAQFDLGNTDLSFLERMVLILGVLIGGACWWLILTSLVNLFRRKINLRRLFWINKIAGGAIVGFVCFAFVVWFFTA